MEALEAVRNLYTSYQEQFCQQELARRPGEGIFGLGMGPKDYPCHGQFAEAMERLLQELAAQHLASDQVRQVLEYIYCAPVARQGAEDAVYWMLLAVHHLTLELLAQLEASDAQALWTEYQRLYPRRKRLDAQDKVLSALRTCAKK